VVSRALSFYRQSAVQGNADGYLKVLLHLHLSVSPIPLPPSCHCGQVGDMHYWGRGGLQESKSNAALYYQVCTILEGHYIMLYYTILYYTILYYTILYYTILYYTILYYTILYLELGV
jgi:TPR repeat protein